MEYLLHILILLCIYATLAVSLDLVMGQLGILSLAHAGFFGVGAYSTALLSVQYQVPFGPGLLVGMALAAILSVAVALPSARLRGDYFVIVTFGFQVMFFSLLNNWVSVTRGPLGIPGIPAPRLFGFTLDSKLEILFLAAGCLAVALIVVHNIGRAPFGRVLRVVREDEVFASSLGKDVIRFKVLAFAVSASLAAAVGSVYASYISFVDPTGFNVMESILLLSMVILGGADTRWGPIVGATALIAFPELLRFVGLPVGVAGNLRQMTYGAMLMIIMFTKPGGIFGGYRFER